MIKDIKDILVSLTHNGYKEFSQGLVPTNDNIMLGVRLPQLRNMAKEIAKGSWREFLAAYELESHVKPYYEEIMLQGMVINYASMDIKERLIFVEQFVPKIDNWAVCDTFCCGAKWISKSKKIVWNFLQPYLKSNKEFEIRYGVIMLLANFLDKEYIEMVLLALDNIEPAVKKISDNDTEIKSILVKGKSTPENYYVEMAVAWCLATAAAKYRDEFFEYINKSNLKTEVLKKTAQKMRDSYRISDIDKVLITDIVKNSIN